MTDRDSARMLKRLQDRWDQAMADLPRLNSIAEVRPNERQVLQSVPGGPSSAAIFELRPVVFNLPERPTHPQSNLYVVLKGKVSFRRHEFREAMTLLTETFSSQVAYFRRGQGVLVHVFGAHYDFALGERGHPAFHVQLKSYAELAMHVREQYNSVIEPLIDNVKGVLKTVRVPTAQMDVFSLFVQICADHLLHSGSSDEETSAFYDLLENRFCQGAGFQVARLGTEEARSCYRARHWYPITVAT